MTAFVFGDEKRAKPKPNRIRLIRMYQNGVSAVRKMSSAMPTVVSPMPADETTRDSILSESRPANGENAACTIGYAMSTSPACCGLSALMYCR